MTGPSDDGALPGMFGDLFRMLGSQNPAQMWSESARALAVNVATAGVSEGSVDPVERIALDGLCDVAVMRVDAVTDGLLAGTSHRLVAVSRSEFALATLTAWTPRIEAMVAARPPQVLPSLSDDQPVEMEAIINQMLTAVGPILLGMQAGSAAGHLAREALGLHHLALPSAPTDAITVVPSNVITFAADWSLDADAARLCALVRERIAAQLFAVPHIAERLDALLQDASTEAGAALTNLFSELQGGSFDMAAMLADPEHMLESLATPKQRWVASQLSALVTALEAVVERFTLAALEGLLGSGATVLEAYRRAATTYGQGGEGAAALFGLDRSIGQIDRGQKFVRGVEERAGLDGLLNLIRRTDGLPTPAELDAPGLWLERLELSAP